MKKFHRKNDEKEKRAKYSLIAASKETMCFVWDLKPKFNTVIFDIGLLTFENIHLFISNMYMFNRNSAAIFLKES